MHKKHCGRSKPTFTCKTCGTITEKSYRTTNQYCSQKCASEARKVAKDEAWHKRNRAVKNEAWQRYHARQKNQTPPDADIKLIQQIYEQCPEGYEVDHIVPISKGGLHHQDNLQYLSWLENRRKGNRLDYPL
jgi:5-methylcytosine-specific restriction endonuclease McrA